MEIEQGRIALSDNRHGAQAGAPWVDAIDVHHHVIPPFYGEALEALGFATSLPGVEPPRWDAEASIDMMDRQGVRAAVVSVWPGVPDTRRGPALDLARRVNEWMAWLVQTRPTRFGAYAILPLPHVDAALEELAYAVDVLGLDGVGMVTNVGGTYVADTAFDPVLEELGRRATPIFVHPTASPASRQQPSFGLPGSLYEFPFETVRLGAQLLYNRTLERFPGLRFILSHGGGGIPYMAERLTYGPIIDPNLAERASADPVGALQRIYYDVAMTGNRFSLPSLRAFAASNRILVGTDFPFMPEWSIEDNARQLLTHGGFSAEELDRVEHGNAEELFPRLGQASNTPS